jgi:hypothetical protein
MPLNEQEKNTARGIIKKFDARIGRLNADDIDTSNVISVQNKITAIMTEIKDSQLSLERNTKNVEHLREEAKKQSSLSNLNALQKLLRQIDREIADTKKIPKEIDNLQKKMNDYTEIHNIVRQREILLAQIEEREVIESDNRAFAKKIKDMADEDPSVNAPPETDLVANLRKMPGFRELFGQFCKENDYSIKDIDDPSKFEFIANNSKFPPIIIEKNSVYSPCGSGYKFDNGKLATDMIALYEKCLTANQISYHEISGLEKNPKLLNMLEVTLAKTLIRLNRLEDTINGKKLADILPKMEPVAPKEEISSQVLSTKEDPIKNPSTAMAFQAIYNKKHGRSTLAPVDFCAEFRGGNSNEEWCKSFCKKHGYTLANIDDANKLEFISNNTNQRSIIIQGNILSTTQSPTSPDEYVAFAEAYAELYLKALGNKSNFIHRITECPIPALLECLEQTLATKLIERGRHEKDSINGKALLLFAHQRQVLSTPRESTTMDSKPESSQPRSTIIRR